MIQKAKYIVGYIAEGALKPESLKKAGTAIGCGIAWFTGEVVARRVVLPACEKVPSLIKGIKEKAGQVRIITSMVVIPAMKAKASSLFAKRGGPETPQEARVSSSTSEEELL